MLRLKVSSLRGSLHYALSPQAKGKIERPYRWIQDRLVRACAREGISDIDQAQLILNNLIQKYNYQWVHSTTGEIPDIRFQRAIREKRSVFKEFTVRSLFKFTKDIFCLIIINIISMQK